MSVSDDRNQSTVVGYTHVFYTKIQGPSGLDSREITSLPETKNIMRTWGVISSIIAENKPPCSSQDLFVYNESLQLPS